MPLPVSGAVWAALVVFAPLLASLACFLLPRRANLIGLAAALGTTVASIGLIERLLSVSSLRVSIGGWGAPLGIDLAVDGLSATMLLMTAVVGLGISSNAPRYFDQHPEQGDYFWPLWLLLWTALNGLFLSADIFNLYVMLELLGLSAAGLTALGGSAAALNAAMRYLFVSLLGSAAYLLGVALLYHAYGTVDLDLLAARISDGPVATAALVAMLAGLLLKTALFPLHFWLPPAHASAPAPVSALLSALVIKGSFYLLLRLWLELFGGLSVLLAELLGLLGAIAIVWGSLEALRQRRLKLLIAYSTVAQIGYLFLAFPLAASGAEQVWRGVIYLALAHGLAKAAMFLSAGSLLRFAHHDRITDLDRVVHRLPLTVTAFMLGGVLAAAYVFKVVGYAFTPTKTAQAGDSVPASMEWSALLLAFGAILLGFAGPLIWPLLETGAPFPGLPLPSQLGSGP
jgi:formate hydrogenlyase subunit 3/multisubunit Na+/H+ antiporter MnhD subunit